MAYLGATPFATTSPDTASHDGNHQRCSDGGSNDDANLRTMRELFPLVLSTIGQLRAVDMTIT